MKILFLILTFTCTTLLALSVQPKWEINNTEEEPYKWGFNRSQDLLFMLTEDEEMDMKVTVYDSETGDEIWAKAFDPEEEDVTIHQLEFYGDNLLILIDDKIELYDARSGEVSFSHKTLFEDWGDISFLYTHDTDTYRIQRKVNRNGLAFGGGITAIDSFLIYRTDDFLTVFSPYHKSIVYEAEIDTDDMVLFNYNNFFVFSNSDDIVLLLDKQERKVTKLTDPDNDLQLEYRDEDFEESMIDFENRAAVQADEDEMVIFLESGILYHNVKNGDVKGYDLDRSDYETAGTFSLGGKLHYYVSSEDELIIRQASDNTSVLELLEENSLGLVDRVVPAEKDFLYIFSFNNDERAFKVSGSNPSNGKTEWTTTISYYENSFEKDDYFDEPSKLSGSIGFSTGSSGSSIGSGVQNNQNVPKAAAIVGSAFAIAEALSEDEVPSPTRENNSSLEHVYGSDLYYEIINSNAGLELFVYGLAFQDSELETAGEGRFIIDNNDGSISSFKSINFLSDKKIINLMNETKYSKNGDVAVIGHKEGLATIDKGGNLALFDYKNEDYETITFDMDTNSVRLTLYNNDTDMNETYFMDFKEQSDYQLHLIAVHDVDLSLFKDSLKTSSSPIYYEDEFVSFIEPQTFKGYSASPFESLAQDTRVEIDIDPEYFQSYDEYQGLNYGYYDNGLYQLIITEETIVVFDKSSKKVNTIEVDYDPTDESGVILKKDKLYMFNEDVVQVFDFSNPEQPKQREGSIEYLGLANGTGKGLLIFDEDAGYQYFE